MSVRTCNIPQGLYLQDYDPNITAAGCNHSVRLVFGQFEYRAAFIAIVGGNCSGLTIIESAIEAVFESLPDSGGVASLIMQSISDEDDECQFDDDEDQGSDFLKDMLISAEIISVIPD